MACVNHPEVVEAAQCAQCGKPVCKDCVITLDGRPLCGPCKTAAVRKVERGDTLDSVGRVPSPWEEKKSVASLFKTAKLVLLSPKEFFGTLKLQGNGYWSYLIILGWPSTLLGALLQQLVVGPGGEAGARTAGIVTGTMLVMAPISILIGTAVAGSFMHLFLRICGGANAKLETTVRTYGFAQAGFLFSWIPFAGPVVGTVWQLVVTIIGLKQMHNTTYGRVIAALFIPMGILLAIAIFAFMAVFARHGRLAPS